MGRPKKRPLSHVRRKTKKSNGDCCTNCKWYVAKFSIYYGGCIEGCANPDPLVGKFGQCCFVKNDNEGG